MNKSKNHILRPPARIGIVGGGQLGRMLTMEAKRLGYEVMILDPTPDCPAGQLSDSQIEASFADKEAIKRLAEVTDVITYEFEHIDSDILEALEQEGYRIHPSARTLKHIQNKFEQKCFLKNAGMPVPKFYPVNSKEEIAGYLEILGAPLMLKTCTGGYDGKGNMVIRTTEDIDRISDDFLRNPLMVEEFIDFKKELSIMAARDAHGNISFYPVVENTHEDSILRLTIAPASISQRVQQNVQAIAAGVLKAFSDIGIFCIELFLDQLDNIYINEIAPRPHNSGHYTIEGCITSQFEQLVRVITGMPMGSTRLITPCAMVNVLGSAAVTGRYTFRGIETILQNEGVYPHFYGKQQAGNLRKLGHITVLGEDKETVKQKALEQLEALDIEDLEEGQGD